MNHICGHRRCTEGVETSPVGGDRQRQHAVASKHTADVAEPTDEVGHVLDDVRGNHVVDRHDRIDVEAVVCCVPTAQIVDVDVIDVADVTHLAAHDRACQRAEFEPFRRGDIDGPQQQIDPVSHGHDPSPRPGDGSSADRRET